MILCQERVTCLHPALNLDKPSYLNLHALSTSSLTVRLLTASLHHALRLYH